MKKIILLVVILFFMGLSSFGQNPCPPGEVPCGVDHECMARRDCQNPNPPPPGLVVPIDDYLLYLITAGLGLGIYFLIASGRKSTSAT